MTSLLTHLSNTFEDEWIGIQQAQGWIDKIQAEIAEGGKEKVRSREEIMRLNLMLRGAKDWLAEEQAKLGRSVANMGMRFKMMEEQKPRIDQD